MKVPKLSILIPTYNRSQILEKCLLHLKKQSFQDFEVIVVNDGSTDNTDKVLKEWSKWKKLRSFKQKNQGQGIARNRGIKAAKSEIILFLGDDIYPDPNFLEEHYKFHLKHPDINLGCLGLTDWYSKGPINAYMKWLVKGGPQFAFYKLKSGKPADFWYFYTSNVSLKKKLLKNEGFDPSFKSYGWEDTELAYRLKKKSGFQLIFHPKARAEHEHFMQESDLEKRMTSIGKNLKIFQKKHKELRLVPHGLKRLVLNTILIFPVKIFLRPLKLIPYFGARFYWTLLSKHYFMKGLKS